jgi:GTP-binding protein HflX
VPWDCQQLRGEIFALCEVLEERAEADAAVFRVRAPRAAIARLGELATGRANDPRYAM